MIIRVWGIVNSTSPHITDFRERFRVNDTMISESDFCRLMTEIQPEILNIASDLPESVCISPMGIQADLALAYFSEKHTDFNVFFNSLFHAIVYNESSNTHEKQCEDHR